MLSILHVFIPLLYFEYLLSPENFTRYKNHQDFSDKVTKNIRDSRHKEKLGENEYVAIPAPCKRLKHKKFWKTSQRS